MSNSIRRKLIVGSLIIPGAFLDLIQSYAHTFTIQAEISTGLPVSFFILMVFYNRRKHLKENPQPSEFFSKSLSSTANVIERRFYIYIIVGWSLLAIAVTTNELYELFNLPRKFYPTISSMLNILIRYNRLTLAASFAIWLSIGYILVTKTVNKAK